MNTDVLLLGLVIEEGTDQVVIRAFTAPQVMALTGLTKRRLQYWEQLVQPSLANRRVRGAHRLYNFRDLVELQVAGDLRRQGIPLQTIRRVVRHLEQLDYRHPLAEISFWSHAGELFFSEAETWRAGRRPEQVRMTFTVPMPQIVESLEGKIRALDERTPGRVEKRRGTLGSKLVIAGTRIPVASIRRLYEDGLVPEEILKEYPDLTLADVQAALKADPPRRVTSRAS